MILSTLPPLFLKEYEASFFKTDTDRLTERLRRYSITVVFESAMLLCLLDKSRLRSEVDYGVSAALFTDGDLVAFSDSTANFVLMNRYFLRYPV